MKTYKEYIKESIENKTEELVIKIKNILNSILPENFNIIVSPYKIMGEEFIKIAFSPNEHAIHNVQGQYPQFVSLKLYIKDMELSSQVFGGHGGDRIYLNPDKENPKEKYLAMVGVKVPFRKPKNEEKFVLNAIEKFAQNYLKTSKDNRDRFRYPAVVDYSFLDNL